MHYSIDPLFSVVIPTYNSSTKLRRALDSVLKQTFPGYEVIVCDDGSTDDTREIVLSYKDNSKIRYLQLDHWGGPGFPRNEGIKIAQGKYVAFLDADDWWYKNKLETIEKLSGCSWDIFYHDLDIFTPRGKRIFKKVKGRQLKSPVFLDLLTNENALITSSVIIKKQLFDSVGGFNDRFLTSNEDFDLWVRLAMVTEKFRYIPRSLGAYWMDGSSISAPSDDFVSRIEYVYNKFTPILAAEDKNQANSVMNYLVARNRQKMGQKNEALKLFLNSIHSRNLKFKSRSIFWVFIVGLEIFCMWVCSLLLKNRPKKG